jgi:hypothetical protein
MNLQKFIDDLFVHGGAMVSISTKLPEDHMTKVVASGFERTTAAIQKMGPLYGRIFAEDYIRMFVSDRAEELSDVDNVLIGDLEDGILRLDVGMLIR